MTVNQWLTTLRWYAKVIERYAFLDFVFVDNVFHHIRLSFPVVQLNVNASCVAFMTWKYKQQVSFLCYLLLICTNNYVYTNVVSCARSGD